MDWLLDLDLLLQNTYVNWMRIPWGDSPESRARFLEQAQANSFFTWFERAMRYLYEMDGPITAENWDDLSSRISTAHRGDPECHTWILRERCGYEKAILDAHWAPGADNGHPEFYRPTYRIDPFVIAYHPEVLDHDQNNPWRAADQDFKHLDEMVDWLDARIGRMRATGGVAVKAAVAHRRAYDPIARQSIDVDTPGPCAGDPRALDYTRLKRPVLPLDPIDDPGDFTLR